MLIVMNNLGAELNSWHVTVHGHKDDCCSNAEYTLCFLL